MKLSINSVNISIDDIYVEYSPLLRGMLNTEVGLEMDGDAYIINVDIKGMKEYIKFLKGEDFHMDEAIASLFDYMGHINTMKYSLDYWKVKLIDNWIRDNLYRLKLYEDSPYYRLRYIFRKKLASQCILKLPPGAYIAGGYAMYLAGYIDTYKDIDVFFTNKETAYAFIELNKKYLHSAHLGPNTFSMKYSSGRPNYDNAKVQLIFRLYIAPTEIVHGFDLDCVGVLYDGAKLWATERTLYAIEHKINWFDPTRASPSYAYRLAKYTIRGFSIGLPLFDPSRIQEEKVDKLFTRIGDLYTEHIDKKYTRKGSITISGDFIDYIENKLHDELKYINNTTISKEDLHIMIERMLDNNTRKDLTPGSMTRYLIGLITTCSSTPEYSNANIKKMLSFIPNDPVSILILSSQYEYFTCLWNQSDYDSKQKYEHHEVDLDCIPWNKVQWKEQNPMEQVSSTFYPTPIQDLKEWYKTSPLYSGVDMKDKCEDIIVDLTEQQDDE